MFGLAPALAALPWLLTGAPAPQPAAPPAEEPSREAHCVKGTFGYVAAGRSLTFAYLQFVMDSPHEWERGWSGYGKRIGSVFGRHVIKHGVEFGVAALRNEQYGYERSEKKGFGPRLTHAVVSTVVTRKRDTGERTVALSTISGVLASGFISRAWMPDRLQTAPAALKSSGISLGFDALGNIVQEFLPRKKKKHDTAGTAK